MTAGIFAHHGVWVGPYRQGDQYNAKGYFESTPFKHLLLKHAGTVVKDARIAKPVDGWREMAKKTVKANGYSGGPWLVKHTALYYRLWHEFTEARYICVRRDLDGVYKSWRKTGMVRNMATADVHLKAMDDINTRLGGVDVYTDEVVRGNYSSLEKAFDYCGLSFDSTIADSFVDPSLWSCG